MIRVTELIQLAPNGLESGGMGGDMEQKMHTKDYFRESHFNPMSLYFIGVP